MFTLFVGKSKTPHVIRNRGCRTQAQFEAVQAHLPNVKYACNNPFEMIDGKEYSSSFSFLYYNNNDKVEIANVTPTGRINRITTAP